MSFLELAIQRFSVRDYLPDPVPEDKLERVIDAARLAPTAANRQPWRLIIVDDPDLLAKMKIVYPRDWFAQAPVVLVLCIAHDEAWRRSKDDRGYGEVDAAIVMDHMVMAATEEDLGTCWIAAFAPAPLYEILGIPEGVEPFLLCTLGFADVVSPTKRRRPRNQLVFRNYWPKA